MPSKEVAFIVPTYAPDFMYTSNLINSYIKFEISAPIHLVFSDTEDLNLFKDTYSTEYSKVTCHIYPEKIYHWPTYYKKWWTINKLLDEFEYFICLDTEMEFVKHVNVYDIVDIIFKSKIYYSHPTSVNTPRGVIQNGATCFNLEEKRELGNILNNWNLYVFWNALPIVETNTAREFIKKYNIVHVSTPQNNNVCAAENLPYQYFMILYHGWKIVDLSYIPDSTYPFGILECGGTNDAMLSIMKPNFTYWLAYKLEQEKFSKHNIFLTIHHDRHDGWYGPPGPPVKFYTAPK
jgi:hypothetical protein